MTFDVHENMGGFALYSYDGFNRLVKIKDGENVYEYEYNGDGQRTAKIINGTRTDFIWDGNNIVAEICDDTTIAYVRGQRLHFKENSNGEILYYLYNGHGDVVQTLDKNKSIVNEYQYDAFGNEINPDANDTNPWRYCGEYYDKETGNIYLRARYYSPSLGRFTTEDPARAGGNWYAYCHNDPINFSDPLGLDENKKLRDLVAETTGSVKWNKKTNTAKVTIDGKTQKYVVQSDGNVTVNDKRVGYLDSDDNIVLWDNDFYKDYKIVGTVTIYSHYDPDDPNGRSYPGDITTGHAWLGYRPIDGEETTYGAWPESMWTRKGINVNNSYERDNINDEHTAKYSKKVTENQKREMDSMINNPKNDTWSVLNNCSSFAIRTFYKTTGMYFGDSAETPVNLWVNLSLKNK